jgi:hypothetical protein
MGARRTPLSNRPHYPIAFAMAITFTTVPQVRPVPSTSPNDRLSHGPSFAGCAPHTVFLLLSLLTNEYFPV